MSSAYRNLEARFDELAALGHAMGILHWDEQTMMPPGAAGTRNASVARLATLAHRLLTADEVGALIEEAKSEALDPWQAANLTCIRRERRHGLALPTELVERQSRAAMAAEQAWRKLRPANDWAGFLPYLEENVALVREEARLRAEQLGVAPYDALLDQYEPGLTMADLDAWFGAIGEALPALSRMPRRRAARARRCRRGVGSRCHPRNGWGASSWRCSVSTSSAAAWTWPCIPSAAAPRVMRALRRATARTISRSR